MNQLLPLSAIIFDMDGLMLDTERINQIAWRRAAAEWGYTFPDEVYLAAVGRTVRDTKALFRRTFGPDFPFEAMYQRKQGYADAYIGEQGLPLKPGLLELLDLVEGLSLAKAIATSTVRSQALKKLTMVGLINRFEILVCGDEIPRGKPAPDIFLAAAERLQVSAAGCLVLEDSEAGIRAAHAAGMQSIMIPDMKQPTPEIASLAYKVLPSLAEVGVLLRNGSLA
jgi:HAD superfamily hydrolase (TIGR01509 family)